MYRKNIVSYRVWSAISSIQWASWNIFRMDWGDSCSQLSLSFQDASSLNSCRELISVRASRALISTFCSVLRKIISRKQPVSTCYGMLKHSDEHWIFECFPSRNSMENPLVSQILQFTQKKQVLMIHLYFSLCVTCWLYYFCVPN